VDHYKEIPVFI
jgi:hypothetical protein